MSPRLYCLTALMALLTASGLTQESPDPEIKYLYVSPAGNDDQSGTRESPLETFDGARQRVRAFRREHPETPVMVYFRGGKYYLKNPVIFTPADNGSPAAPVAYRAYPGETPYILGGEELNLTWQAYRPGIYKAKVPEGLSFESLYINDSLQVLARYPNFNQQAEIFNGYAADCLAPERVQSWEDPAGGYFHVIHGSRWGGFHFQITGKRSETELTFTGGWQNNRPEGGQHPEFRFVENVFEELDTIHEWYLDRNTSTLYFFPSPDLELDDATVEFASLENLITFRGTIEDPVEHITLDGFSFRRTVRTFLKNREPLLRSDWTIYRGGALFLEGTENCAIRNCEFTQVGGNAIFFNHYNKNGVVTGCHIHGNGANGICLVGDTAAVRNPKFVPYGPRVSLEEMDHTPGPINQNFPRHCTVENNLIHNIGTIEKQVAGVEISMAAFITLRHNSIYDLPRAGINIGEGAWGGHLLEYNDVFNTVLETGDHGSFNSWGRDRFWGTDKERMEGLVEADPALILLDMLAPNIIRNNRFRCDHGWDIDLDDGSSYYEIYNNLCLNGGIKLREGYYRTVQNNICINNGLHPHVWLKNSGDVVRGNIFGAVHQPIYVDHWGKEVDYNWFIHPDDLEKVRQLGEDRHSRAGDPGFVEPKGGDFSLEPGSPVYGMGWKNFPMDAFGVQKPELKAIAETPVIPDVIQTGIVIDNMVSFYSGRVKNLSSDGEVSATGMAEKTGVLVLLPPQSGIFETIELQKNDVILGVDEEPVRNVSELRRVLEAGQPRSLSVWRDQRLLQLGN